MLMIFYTNTTSLASTCPVIQCLIADLSMENLMVNFILTSADEDSLWVGVHEHGWVHKQLMVNPFVNL